MTEAAAKPDRYMRKAEVLTITGLSHTTLYRLMDAGKFPRQYALGEKAVAWKASDVKAWCETRPIKGD